MCIYIIIFIVYRNLEPAQLISFLGSGPSILCVKSSKICVIWFLGIYTNHTKKQQ